MTLRFLFILVFSLFGTVSLAQYSIGGGLSTFNSTNTGITRVGINLFYEQPHNEVMSFYLRGMAALPSSSTDTVSLTHSENFNIIERERVRRTNFLAVDGGTRRYIFNTYESAFAVYGSIHMKGVLSNYREEIDNFDPETYDLNVAQSDNNIALLLGLGANLGFTYQLPYRGTLTFDGVLDVFQRLYDPGGILGDQIGGMGLTFNFSYRHDIF